MDLATLNTCLGSKRQILNIRKSHEKALDLPAQRCATGSAHVNTSVCIADFIEGKLGCNPSIYGGQYSKGLQCNTTSQLSQLEKISIILSESYDNDIYAMTGCLSSCEKDIYNVIQEPMTCIPNGVEGSFKFLLQLRMTDRSYEERKQYVIYDHTSFIADVGGYMGLLLGCSLLSLYNELETIINRFIIRPLFGRMQDKRMGEKVRII